jgi:hypothetical protein
VLFMDMLDLTNIKTFYHKNDNNIKTMSVNI